MLVGAVEFEEMRGARDPLTKVEKQICRLCRVLVYPSGFDKLRLKP